MNTIFHLKKALFYSTILLSLIILLEGCKKKISELALTNAMKTE